MFLPGEAKGGPDIVYGLLHYADRVGDECLLGQGDSINMRMIQELKGNFCGVVHT